MQNFANQCLDLARAILGHNLGSINPDGTITPVEGESVTKEESAHALAAIGEFYRATHETVLQNFNLVDLAAKCLKHQIVHFLCQ